MSKELRQGIRCTSCGDVIVSMHRHDFVWCSCRKVYVDGGKSYLRIGGTEWEQVTAKQNRKGKWIAV